MLILVKTLDEADMWADKILKKGQKEMNERMGHRLVEGGGGDE
jgi:hypothetical protein